VTIIGPRKSESTKTCWASLRAGDRGVGKKLSHDPIKLMKKTRYCKLSNVLRTRDPCVLL
jgi:hypothetical protein